MKTKKYYSNFASVSELSDTLATMKPHKAWKGNSLFEQSDTFIKRWAGETFSDSLDKLRSGDAEAAAKIKAQGELIAEASVGRLPKIETSIIGCLPNVPNYLRGVPNNMLRVINEPRQTPVIDMYINCSIYDGIDTNKVAKAAAMIANLIAGCEAADIRVNLFACCGVSGNGHEAALCVKIKDADTPLNLLNIGYCICNRAFFRATFIYWMESTIPDFWTGHGAPSNAQHINQTFDLEGLFFDIMEIVRCDYDFEYLENKTNDYIKSLSDFE